MKRPPEYLIEEAGWEVMGYITELEAKLKRIDKNPKPVIHITLTVMPDKKEFAEVTSQIKKLRECDLGKDYHIVLSTDNAKMEIVK